MGIVRPSMKNLFNVLRRFQISRVRAKVAISATMSVMMMVAMATTALLKKYLPMWPTFSALA